MTRDPMLDVRRQPTENGQALYLLSLSGELRFQQRAGMDRSSAMEGHDVLTVAFFTRRLADLCLRSGMSGLPRDDASRHVLFTSMAAALPIDTPLDQPVIDERLTRWIETSGIKELDHVTLRRSLVDAGYLYRRPNGSGYRVVADPPGRPPCEAGVADVDLAAVLEARREEVARRKAEYLARPRK